MFIRSLQESKAKEVEARIQSENSLALYENAVALYEKERENLDEVESEYQKELTRRAAYWRDEVIFKRPVHSVNVALQKLEKSVKRSKKKSETIPDL